jgi:hypothetical protein
LPFLLIVFIFKYLANLGEILEKLQPVSSKHQVGKFWIVKGRYIELLVIALFGGLEKSFSWMGFPN